MILKNYYYFPVKSKLELYSSEWLRNKKEAIIDGDNCFQNALNDALDYQRIKKKPARNIKNIKNILVSITGKIETRISIAQRRLEKV